MLFAYLPGCVQTSQILFCAQVEPFQCMCEPVADQNCYLGASKEFFTVSSRNQINHKNYIFLVLFKNVMLPNISINLQQLSTLEKIVNFKERSIKVNQ